MKKFIYILPLVLLCRCASLEKTIGMGVGIGAATGIAAAQIARYNLKGNAALGVGGALLGGAIALFFHKRVPDLTPAPSLNIIKTGPPPLTDAEKDVLLIPDKIEGDQFIEKHRIWTIKKPAHWQLRDGQPHPEETEENEADE